MPKIASYGFVMLAALFCLNGIALADDSPTIDQVYQAAHAGRMDDAQRMMNVVLRNHPNSAKAHFVEAELLSRQGLMAQAGNELSIAKRLNPDLSFATPVAVQELKNRIAAASSGLTAPANTIQESGNHFPWVILFFGLGIVALVVFILRAIGSRNPANFQGNYQPGWTNGAASPLQMPPYGGGMAPMGSSGIGSGIMGGLATGAAVGVGMVAGEALAHRFMDGGGSNPVNATPVADGWENSGDLGGADFGITDNSSWNDNGSLADIGSDVGGGDWT